MSSLGPESRALIADAEGADAPCAADKERVRGKLAALGVLTASSAVGATAKAAGTAIATKLIVAIAVTTGVAVGFVAFRRPDVGTVYSATNSPGHADADAGTARSGEVGAVAAASAQPGANGANGAIPAFAIESETEDDEVSRESAVSSPGPRAAVVVARAAASAGAPASPQGSAQPPPAPAEQGSSSAAAGRDEGEATLLRRAQAAIEQGDGVRALELLDAHAARYPNGVLADQREAERVIALCALGRGPAAREAAGRFLAARPRASQAERVRRACRMP